MTDGLFIKEILSGKTYDFVIVDEVHERSLRTEFILLYLQKNKFEKLIFMSATVTSTEIETFYKCKRINLRIKGYRSEVFYEKEPVPDYLFAAYYRIKKIIISELHNENPSTRDILVFLPGEEDILEMKKMLKRLGINAILVYSNATYDTDKDQRFLTEKRYKNTRYCNPKKYDGSFNNEEENIQTYETYSSNKNKTKTSSIKDQVDTEYSSNKKKRMTANSYEDDKIKPLQTEEFFQNDLENLFVKREDKDLKVILATNIAETSITIPNIKYVIDSGLQKTKIFHNINYMGIQEISKESAEQRKGRCNRIADGICYRLYTEKNFAHLKSMIPEMMRCNISDLFLWLLSVGIDPLRTNFISKPSKKTALMAYEFLFEIGAIKMVKKQEQHSLLKRFEKTLNQMLISITSYGKELIKYPLDVSLAHFQIIANKMSCGLIAAKIIALVSEENHNFLLKPMKSDILSLLDLFNIFLDEEDGVPNQYNPQVANLDPTDELIETKKECFDKFHFLRKNKINISALKRAALTFKQLSTSATGKVTQNIEKAFSDSYKHNLTLSQPDGSYKTMDGTTLFIHPSSFFFRKKMKKIVFVDVLCTNKPYMRIIGRFIE